MTPTELAGCPQCNPTMANIYGLPVSPRTASLPDDWRNDGSGGWKSSWRCAMCPDCEIPEGSKNVRVIEVGVGKWKYQHTLCGSYLGDALDPQSPQPAPQSDNEELPTKLHAIWRGVPYGISPIAATSGNRFNLTLYPAGGTHSSGPSQPVQANPICTCGHDALAHNALGTGVCGICHCLFFITQVCHVCGLFNHTTPIEKMCSGYPVDLAPCVGCGAGPGDPHVIHQGALCPHRQSVLRADGLIP